MPELTIDNVSKRFPDVQAVDSVSLRVEEGEFFTLLGPSGCGKSTTLATIAGLEHPDQGTIWLGDAVFADAAKGRSLPPEQRNLGMVFQSYALWPHMSVERNVGLPLRLRKVGAKERQQRVSEILDQVGLAEVEHRYPHQLSGGQQQRVALARALVYSPGLLLLDEPLSNLDAKLRDRARAWLKQLQSDLGVTTVYVTHDQLEALSLSDRIAVMGEGKLLQVDGPRGIYERPVTPEVAAFVGRCNFLQGQIRANDAETGYVLVDLGTHVIRVDTAVAHPEGSSVTVGVRAEKLRVGTASYSRDAENPNVLPMHLDDQSYVGARYEYQLTYGDTTIQAEGASELSSQEVEVGVPPEGCVLFAEDAKLSGQSPEPLPS